MKTIKNTENVNPMVDNRIVRLNEIKAISLANVSKSRRPKVKVEREIAKFILNSWDDKKVLKGMNRDEMSAELVEILDSRLNDFKPAASTAKPTQPAKAEKKQQPKQEVKEVKENETKKEKKFKQVGDIHPNGKWVWTEYAKGKFDWRTIPELKHQGQKAGGVKTAPVSKANKTTKVVKEVKIENKELTIEEFLAKPKNSKNNKKPSDAQKEALKFIAKGYRITSDLKFFEKDGERKECNWNAVVAMLARYGVNYVPNGLVK